MFYQVPLASNAIVLQPVREIVGRGWSGHELACHPKSGKPVEKVTDHDRAVLANGYRKMPANLLVERRGRCYTVDWRTAKPKRVILLRLSLFERTLGNPYWKSLTIVH
jgi:hypothetical protein